MEITSTSQQSDETSDIERDYVRWYPARIAAIDDISAWRQPSMGLYLHIPFCVQRCHFCKYKVRVGADQGDEMAEFLVAMGRELDVASERGPVAGRGLNVVFIGGGTPSLLSPRQLEDLIGRIRSRFSLDADCEFSIECHPGSLTREKLAVLQAGGVNRLSVGVQSFDDEVLEEIGRDHTGAQARQALEMVAEAGFTNVNLDLIYRLPGQSIDAVCRSITDALEYHPTHLSLYPLWIREGTILWARMQAGELTVPDEQTEARMFDTACDMMTERGYEHYNVFDFVAAGSPRCRYTELQWEDGDWIGLGPSAVSYIQGRHLINTHSIRDYVAQLSSSGSAVNAGAMLDTEARMRRTMMFGLRMNPFDTRRFRRQYGVPAETVFGAEIDGLVSAGLVVRDGAFLRLTRDGIRRTNNIGKVFYQSPDDRQSLGVSRRGIPLVEIDR
jgi:oxygen-independent coproporphyrinogen-3 oxidase